MEGESRLGPHLHPHDIGWKAVEGKQVSMQCDMDVAPKAQCDVTVRWDVTLCGVPVAKRGWNVPLAVESVEASVLICMRTLQRTTSMRKTHKLSCCLE